ncbi:MAG: hypothetical protein KGJ59_14605 [Bacteroidota bacterium]|nr:hypothetical protein [Bacteroidota bacterium]
MMKFRAGVHLVLFQLLLLSCLHAQDSTCFFYHGYPYGTEANYNPLSLIMNGSFDILQIENRNNKLFSLCIANGARNVFDNITHPSSRIAQYGAHHFWTTEVFPTSIKLQNTQYWPNYKLHLIGGGMSYIGIAEWYRLHGFSYPKTMSFATMVIYHYLNETVENNDYVGPTVDPIADLLIFDPAGILLFSIDGVPEFFSKTLNAADWSNQPLISFPEKTLVNNGQIFSFKIPLPFVGDKWKLLYLTGVEGVLGLSYRYNETDWLSVGGGLVARDLVEVENTTGVRTQTTSLIYTGGIYYDRNNSLLASLVLGGARGYIAKTNIYPGLFDLGPLPLGVVFLLQKNYTVLFGICTSFSPLGLAYAFR